MSTLRISLRSLFKARAFTPLAIATIAIGLGATTAVFSIVESLLLRDRPGLVDERSLVDIGCSRNGSGFDNFGWPDFLDYRAQNTVFTDVAAARFGYQSAGLAVDGRAEDAHAQMVSANYFPVLGTRLALGRNFAPSADPVPEIILSYRYWQRRFNGDPAVIGRAVLYNNAPVTIVGVTELGFDGASIVSADFWAPFSLLETLEPGSTLLQKRANAFLMAVARLKPGVTLAQAQAEMSLLAQRLEKAYPESNKGHGAVVAPSSRLPGEMRLAAAMASTALFLLTGLALAVACANVAGLLLARGAARRRELAVRAALGATRGRLIAQLLGEHLLLFLAGGLVGGFIAVWLVNTFVAVLPSLPIAVSVHPEINPLAFAFCLGIALLAGLAFGLAPALNSTRIDVLASLRSNEQPAGGRIFSLRNLFLILQLSLSLALLTTAGLLVKALGKTALTDPGFDARHVEFVRFDFRSGGLTKETGPAFAEEFLARAAALPNVRAAAWSVAVPLDDTGRSFGELWNAGSERSRENEINTDWNLVSPAYFETLGNPLVAGRSFTTADLANTTRVAIVNETFARRIWPGQDALGQTLVNEEGQTIAIVGVARDAKYRSLGEPPRNMFFVPSAQTYHHSPALFVRLRDGNSILPQVRTLLAQLLPGLPVARAETLESFAATSLLPYRIASGVAAGAGALSLLLAGMGVYGATLYRATQRTREFGVRLALGSTRGQLIALVLRGSLGVAAIAIGLGLAASFGLGQVVKSFLFGAPGADAVVFLGTAGFFLALVVLAAWLPARRATRVDPMVALRAE